MISSGGDVENRPLGIHLDPLGVQVASPGSSPETWDLPPSALLPIHPGEPVRADLTAPAHTRGDGGDWPPQSGFDDAGGCGRFPLTYAWALLHQNRTDPWSWNPPDGSGGNGSGVASALSAADAVAAALGGVCARGNNRSASARAPLALVMPDAFDEARQERLITAIRQQQGLAVQLLWRPVAAAIDWCGRHEARLLAEAKSLPDEAESGHTQTLGRLLVLHFGLEAMEAACLSVVAYRHADRWTILPGRHRPRPDHTRVPGFWPEAEAVVKRSFGSDARSWSEMWADAALARLARTVSSLPNSDAERAVQRLWEESRHAGDRPMLPPTRRWLGAALPSRPTASDWLASIRAAIHPISPDDPVLGVLCTGPFAGARADGRLLARRFVRDLGVAAAPAIEGRDDLPSGLLAAGAAEFLRRLQTGQPTYLDTLPRIDLCVHRTGDPDREWDWQPLLQETDEWVLGGREWRRDPDLSGFEVVPATDESGATTFKLTLRHEEYPTVREVSAVIDEELADRVPVRLAVRVTPAQGRARLQLVPEVDGALGRRPVFVDWERMKEDEKKRTPEAYLADLPRTFPPLMPRHASRDRWSAVAWRVERLLPVLKRRRIPVAQLEELGTELNMSDGNFQRDPQTGSRYATAVDQDGSPPLGLPSHELTELIDLLCEYLPDPAEPPDDTEKPVIRVLGYASAGHQKFQSYLSQTIRKRGTELEDFVVHAVGWALRDPKDCAAVAEVIALIARRGQPPLYWIKSFAHLLRYRAKATRDMDSAMVLLLCRVFADVFSAQRQRGSGAHLFKWSALAIVFLLRRRAYDADFLDPDSKLAGRIKVEFARAFFASDRFNARSADTRKMRDWFPDIARRTKRNTLRMQRGAIDVQKALVQLIEYIDRQGHGRIELIGDDE